MKRKVRRAIEEMVGKESAIIYYRDEDGPGHITGLVEKVTDRGVKLKGHYPVEWRNIETFISDNKRFTKQDFQ